MVAAGPSVKVLAPASIKPPFKESVPLTARSWPLKARVRPLAIVRLFTIAVAALRLASLVTPLAGKTTSLGAVGTKPGDQLAALFQLLLAEPFQVSVLVTFSVKV